MWNPRWQTLTGHTLAPISHINAERINSKTTQLQPYKISLRLIQWFPKHQIIYKKTNVPKPLCNGEAKQVILSRIEKLRTAFAKLQTK